MVYVCVGKGVGECCAIGGSIRAYSYPQAWLSKDNCENSVSGFAVRTTFAHPATFFKFN